MAAKGMPLYEQKHAFTFVVSEDSDGAGYLSRDTFVAEGGANGVDFLVGDIFAVVDGKAVKLNPSATDGSEKFAGIAGYRARAPAARRWSSSASIVTHYELWEDKAEVYYYDFFASIWPVNGVNQLAQMNSILRIS